MALLLNTNDVVTRSYSYNYPSPTHNREVKGVGDRTGNLFEVLDKAETTVQGVTYRIENQTLYLNGTCNGNGFSIKLGNSVSLSAGVYTNAFKGFTGARVYYSFNNDNSTMCTSNVNLSKTFTIYENHIFTNPLVWINPNTSFNDVKINFMLNSGSTPLPYEPYGYRVPVVSRGKNLFDKSKIMRNKRIVSTTGIIGDLGGCYCSDKISVSPNTKYTLSGIGGISTYTGHGMAFFNSNGDFINKGELTAKNNINTFTTPNDVYYVIFNATLENVDNCQLELGSTATEYTPYRPPITTTQYLPTPLMANERLTPTAREMKWGVKVFDGSETLIRNSGQSEGYTTTYLSLSDEDVPILNNLGYCSHFSIQTTLWGNDKEGFQLLPTQSSFIRFRISNSIANDAALFKAWLKSEYDKGTPVTVWYQLANPTTEPVTTTPIGTLDGECWIDVDTEIEPVSMSATYKSSKPDNDMQLLMELFKEV